MAIALTLRREIWPIAGAFTISRGSKTAAEVVVVEITDGAVTGRGECTPYRRYGETVAGVTAAIERLASRIGGGLDRAALQGVLPAGAARNALDCALIDFEAKRRACPAHELLGIPPPRPRVSALYDLARLPRKHGGGGGRCLRASLVEGQARRRRRPGADRGGPRCRAARRTDRRCQ
jgi:L-alanine-DL-glutamate epimerase-like enolase superfamily enzyme